MNIVNIASIYFLQVQVFQTHCKLTYNVLILQMQNVYVFYCKANFAFVSLLSRSFHKGCYICKTYQPKKKTNEFKVIIRNFCSALGLHLYVEYHWMTLRWRAICLFVCLLDFSLGHLCLWMTVNFRHLCLLSSRGL